MTAPRSRTHVCCPYCLGWFLPSRSDAATCSDACRQAMRRALDPENTEPLTPLFRRDATSAERGAATGWRLLTPSEQYAADVRVRRAAGLPVDVMERYLADDDAGAFKRQWHESRLATRGAA